jgi:hypothetical protein
MDVTDTGSRYEIRDGADVAGFAVYRRDGDTTTFTHTEVEPAYEGHGVGSELVRAALDAERAAGHHVAPRCPFVRSWIDRHPDYADLVAV